MTAFSATAALTSLPGIRDYVLAKAQKANVPISLEPKLDLVLEEILVNVANHAYGGDQGKVEVECSQSPGAFCCTVRDWGVPFNPLSTEEPDLDADIDDRPIGGLGLFLVTTMSNECSYTRKNDVNELTFCFSY